MGLLQEEKDAVRKESEVNPIQSAFDVLSKDHDIGNINSFTEDMTKDDSRRSVFNKLSERFDIGTFESFSDDFKPFLPPSGAKKFGLEVARAAEDFLFTIPTILGDREAKSKIGQSIGQHGIIGTAREGVIRALPLSPEQEEATREFLSTPLLPVREWLPEEAPLDFLPDSLFGVDIQGARDVGWSITKGVARVVEGFSSPENMALILGTGGVGVAARAGSTLAQTAGRIIPAIFSADMIAGEPELIEGIVHAVEHGDADEAIELATVATLTAGLAFAAGREALRRSVKGENVVSEEAKPYIDRMRVAMQDAETKKKFMESSEERQTLIDDINANSNEARLAEVRGESPKVGRFKGESGEFEQAFGVEFEDVGRKALTEKERVDKGFGLEGKKEKEAIQLPPGKPVQTSLALVKFEGKPVKEYLQEIKAIGENKNLKVEREVGFLANKVREAKNKEDFLNKVYEVPIKDVDIGGITREQVLKGSGTLKSKQADAPVTVGVEADGAIKLLDGIHRLFSKEDAGKKTIKIRFAVDEGAERFYAATRKKTVKAKSQSKTVESKVSRPINFSEGLDSQSKQNAIEAISFLDAKFPRIMSKLNKIRVITKEEMSKLTEGISGVVNGYFNYIEKGGTIVEREAILLGEFVRPLPVADLPRSPQVSFMGKKGEVQAKTTRLTPTVEDYISVIAHEARHAKDIMTFGVKEFEAMGEIGKIESKQRIGERAERIEERGLRLQNYLVALRERRAFAQARTAIRVFREQFNERTTKIRAFSKGFSEEGYNPIHHDLKKAWELYDRRGSSYEEFSRDMRRELGEGIDSYLKRFSEEQKAMGESPHSDKGGEPLEVFREDVMATPEATPENRLGEQKAMLERLKEHDKKWYQSLADVFSVQARFVRLKAIETGVAIKNFFSIESLWQDKALKGGRDIVSSIRKPGEFRPNQVALQELALLAESKSKRTGKYDGALRIWDTLKAEGLSKLRELGEPFKPHANMVRELISEIAKREYVGENVLPHKRALAAANTMKTVSHEASLWMESLIRRDPSLASEVFLRMVRNGEKSVTFTSILETGIVTPEMLNVVDIVGMFGRRVGLDVAVLEVRRAAVADGLAKKRKRLKSGKLEPIPLSESSIFTDAPTQAKSFRDYAIHPSLKAWLNKMTKPKSKGAEIIDRGISSIKMAAFWNPLFLPMYDIYQAAMAGVLRPHLIGAAIGGTVGGVPGIAIGFLAGEAITRRLYRGFAHAVKQSKEFNLALENGMTSTPFPNPFDSFNKQLNHVKRTLAVQKGQLGAAAITNGLELTAIPQALRELKAGENALKVIAKLPLEAIQNMYNLSWGIAWQLDHGVRMATNMFLQKKGFTAKESAQLAARYHGDYASVPVETRKMLNRFFFTPTFKIAMGKLQVEMINSAIKGVKGGPEAWGDVIKATVGSSNKTKKLTPREAQMASSLLYAGSIIMGYHMFMQANGFEMDEFGVKYKRQINTDEGVKDLVVNHSTPVNLYVKYFNRIKGAFDAGPQTAAKKLFNSFSWEITPIFRVTRNWINNRDDNGDPIILTTDSNITKLGKSMKYLVLNTYQMVGLIGADEDQVQIPTYKFRNQELELEINRHLNLCRKALRLGWIDEFYEWKKDRIYYFEIRILGDVEEKTKQLEGMFPQLMEPKDE